MPVTVWSSQDTDTHPPVSHSGEDNNTQQMLQMHVGQRHAEVMKVIGSRSVQISYLHVTGVACTWRTCHLPVSGLHLATVDLLFHGSLSDNLVIHVIVLCVVMCDSVVSSDTCDSSL